MKARAAAVAALLLCAGCSSSGAGKPHSDSTVAPKNATITSMLALLPDNAATRDAPTTVNLYWKAARIGHIAVPPAGRARRRWAIISRRFPSSHWEWSGRRWPRN